MARTGQPATRHVAAVERAVAVLDALADGGELGTNELARRTGLNASTVSRLLATLADAGLVEHVAETGRYRLGLRLLELGNAVLARLDLREIARPHLRALVEETGETATLSAPGEPDAVTVDFVQSAVVGAERRAGRAARASPTRPRPARSLLAFGEASSRPAGSSASPRGRSSTGRARRARSSASARRAGHEAAGEREDDLNAVAAPVLGSRGELVGHPRRPGPAPRASTRRRWRARSSRCSRMQRRSPTL